MFEPDPTTSFLCGTATPYRHAAPFSGGGRVKPDHDDGLTKGPLTLTGLLSALIVFVADQASKWWVLNVLDLPDIRQIVVLPFLNFTMVWNRGVTFGLFNSFGDWGHIALAGVSMLVVAALGVWLWRAQNWLVAIALGSIAGGAIGNVVDRLRFGAVVDFIHAHADTPWGDISWYVFNVGDAAIVCGVAALVFDSQWPRKRADP